MKQFIALVLLLIVLACSGCGDYEKGEIVYPKTDFYAYSTPDNARKIRTGFDLSERNAHMKEGRDFWGINGELKVLSTDDDVICVEFVPLERENGELTKKNVQDNFKGKCREEKIKN